MNQVIEEAIDLTLRKNLSSEELSEALRMLKKDLSEETVDKHFKLMQGIDAYGIQKQRTKLRAIHSRHYNPDTAKKAHKFGWYKILLTLAAVLVLVASLFISRSKYFAKTPNAIFAEYYKPYDYSSGHRGASEESVLSLGVLYREGKFDNFLEKFETHFKNKQDLGSDLVLAAGIAYLETNQPYKAIFQFTKIINNNDFNYTETAYWYGALSLMKAGEYNSSIEKLEKLKGNENSEYAKDSERLIEDLKLLIRK